MLSTKRIDRECYDALAAVLSAGEGAVECVVTVQGLGLIDCKLLRSAISSVIVAPERRFWKLRIDPFYRSLRISSPETGTRLVPCRWLRKNQHFNG